MNTSPSRALWITAAHAAEIRTETLAELCDDEVQVRTLFSGISRGTESLVYSGQVPSSEHDRMRAPFQAGEFTFPVKYGYINVGQVEKGPVHLIDKYVFSLFPHQTLFNVPQSSVTVLPDGIPPARAVLTANMETAINALWDAPPGIGDRVTVIGAGVLGSLVAYLAARIIGCTVQLVDINTQRAALADELGLRFCTPAEAENEQDLIIHTSASEQGLNSALQLAGFEATIVELSWFGTRQASLCLGGAFHSQRLQFKSSQVGHIAPTMRSRWDYARRLQLALSLLDDSKLDALISGESHFAELPETLAWLCQPGNASLCHRITYE